jgi:DNA-binding MarR family transcriptional regulator
LLQLTPEGRKLYKNLMPHVQEIANSLFATMAADELETFSKLIDKMTARLEADSEHAVRSAQPGASMQEGLA